MITPEVRLGFLIAELRKSPQYHRLAQGEYARMRTDESRE